MILYKKKKKHRHKQSPEKYPLANSLMQIKKEVADPKLVLRVLPIGQVLWLIPRLHADT